VEAVSNDMIEIIGSDHLSQVITTPIGYQ